MFKNYFVITYRLFLRYKVYSFINIMGFALGLAVFLLILLFIRHELSYDRFYKDHDRIFRVTRSWYNDDGKENLHLARVAPPVGPLLEEDYPDMLEEVVRVLNWSPILKIGDKKFEKQRMFLAEDNFFRLFSTPVIEGDPSTCLKDPGSVVLSQTTARQFFGEEDPMGKTLETSLAPLTVTGVFEDVPENTHFKYDVLVSFSSLENYIGRERLMHNWSSNNYVTYIKFAANTSPDQLASRLDDFIDRHYTPIVAEYLGKEPEERVSKRTRLHLQKLTDIHLKSHLSTELEPNGDIRTVYIFSSVALFILLIAAINFINLSTARSANRAKEVAVRKVAGAGRRKLVMQFLMESLFFILLALVLAVVAVDLVLPAFSNFIGRDLNFAEVGSVPVTFILLGIGVLVGILSGMYPAFYLSRFRPVRVLRASFKPGRSSTPLRTILVIVQFAISIALIISIGTINRQLKYIQTRDTGFDRDNLLVVNAGNGDILGNIENFKSRLLADPGITGVSTSRLIPSNDLINSSGARTLDGENPGPVPFRLAMVSIDYDFFKNLGIKILAGRNFSREFSTDDSTAFILNAAAVRQLGWGDPENAVGRPFQYSGVKGSIIGVADDINFETLHNPVVPIIYFVRPDENEQLCIRVTGKNLPATVDFIKKVYDEYVPNGIFDYTFLDEIYNDNYRTEFQLGKVMFLFSILAIIIACLGLFGLSSFLSELKSKEVGIRKVLGASVSQVVARLGTEFTRWVIVANLLAWPAAWYLMNRWLGNFAYHIGTPWLIFVLAAVVSLLIAILTVSFQAVRSAVRNPVESIKYE